MSRALRFGRAIAATLGQAWWRLLTAPAIADATGAWLAVTVAALSAVGIGLADRASGINLSIIYVLPALFVSVAVGSRAGLVLAAETAVIWGVADPSHESAAWSVIAVDSCLRFLAVALMVGLVGGLRSAAMRANRSEARSRDFLALAAHQLRTPVSGLRASAEALIATGGSPSQERLLANVAMEADRAGRLVNALLAMNRIDADQAPPTAPVDVHEVCGSAVGRAAFLAPHLQVRFDPHPDRPVALANEEALRSILTNLLENGMRHAQTAIGLRVDRSSGQVVITVDDDGPGLPAGSEETAFHRFVSLDGHGGSGLGLPLSRGLARMMGGDLSYRAGTFVVALPAAGAARRAGNAPRPGPTVPRPGPTVPRLSRSGPDV